MDYNYQRFSPKNYEYARFDGPKAGEKMLDFTLHTFDGKQVKLSDYKDKWVVIETASLTCPMFVKNVNPIKKLIAQYPDVEFLVVYVREAHPGSRVGPHKDMKEKIEVAKRTKNEYGDDRTMLVDNLKGEMHQAYGAFPNMVYVVDPKGTVVYRCDWTYAHLIERVLQDRPNLNHVERKKIITAAPWIMFPVILKGGWDALYDQLKGLPLILWGHLKADIGRMFQKKEAN